ncbi:hypothetical protein CRE_20116 [Caenorhabditis remanei]|uniref:Uncharacterized protein n=1 Tax=Caenorhabditis remanei TaxID=31234 RepID=E3NP52_CAERE|nr:hypothetical protein CRE_20116 [Caenorhabditis remanei]
MTTSFLLLVCFFIMIFRKETMCQSVCKTVTCYGQAICHEIDEPYYNGTLLPIPKVAQCSDKNIEDYIKDIIASKNIEFKAPQLDELTNFLNYIVR